MYRVINRNFGLDETVASLAYAKVFTTPAGRPNVIFDTESDATWVSGAYPNRQPEWHETSRAYAEMLVNR